MQRLHCSLTLQPVQLHRLRHPVEPDMQRLERRQALQVGQRAEAVLLDAELAEPREADERIRVDVTDAVPIQHELLRGTEGGTSSDWNVTTQSHDLLARVSICL